MQPTTFFVYYLSPEGQLKQEQVQIDGGTIQAFDWIQEHIVPKATPNTDVHFHEFKNGDRAGTLLAKPPFVKG